MVGLLIDSIGCVNIIGNFLCSLTHDDEMVAQGDILREFGVYIETFIDVYCIYKSQIIFNK